MKRDFKGVWIPREIWLSKDLSLIEKCIMVEIDSLDNDTVKGCFASNAYFAEFFDLSESRIANILTGLKKRGYIKQVYFDGRIRGLRSLIPKGSIPENGKADLPKVRKQNTRKREHNNTVDNKVDISLSTNVDNEFEEVISDFEKEGEPIPVKIKVNPYPPKLRESPPTKPANEMYLLYEAWAKFAEAKHIPVSRTASGNYLFEPKNAAALKSWKTWVEGMPNYSGDLLADWHAFLEAAWQKGGKWIQANFTPVMLNSKRQEIVMAINRHKSDENADLLEFVENMRKDIDISDLL